MKKLLAILTCVVISCVEGSVSLSRLLECDREECVQLLGSATDAELWDVFLKGQAELFFESEFSWISKGSWWHKSKNILEIGSGNGSYLHRLSKKFPEKLFQGIEKQSHAVVQAQSWFKGENLDFREGDAEVFDKSLVQTADIVLFRLTLQHLKDATKALKNAAKYLKPQGHIVIIDSCDMANESSHSIPALEEALRLVAEVQTKKGTGNRRVTFDLMQSIDTQAPPLSEMYKIAASNLDIQGKLIGDSIRFEGEQNRKRYFNHALLFITLLYRTYHVPVDTHRAYDELKEYIADENAWTSIGMHLLVLEKALQPVI